MRRLRRTMKKRGSGLMTVLTASALMLMMALTVTGTSFHHLSLTNRLNHAQRAQNLAESGLAKIVAELMVTHNRYQDGTDPTSTFIELPYPEDQGVYLAFTPGRAASVNSSNLSKLQLRTSYNNFGNDAAYTFPDGRSVPPDSAYLCAVARDHGVERMAECVIYLPKFPWALAASGPIHIEGKSKITSVKDVEDLGNPDKELPGHLVSNSTSATDAIEFSGDEIEVTGDVQASGGANLGSNVVRGERRLFAGQAAIPEINLDDYDTEHIPGVRTVGAGDNVVSGYGHRTGNWNLSSGLTLDGGIVFVKGDITISGQLQGEGALMATGKITVTGNGQLASNNKVALLSKQGIELNGGSSESERLRVSGLLYTEGNLTTHNTDVMGTAIGAGSSSSLTLTDSSIVTVSKMTTFEVAGFDNTYSYGGMQFRIEPQTGASALYYTPTQPKDADGAPLPAGVYEARIKPDGAVYNVAAPAGTPPTPVTANDLFLTSLSGETFRTSDSVKLAQARQEYIDARPNPNIPGSEIAAGQLFDALVSPSNERLLSNASYATYLAAHPEEKVEFKVDLNGQNKSGQQFISRAERIRLLYWREGH